MGGSDRHQAGLKVELHPAQVLGTQGFVLGRMTPQGPAAGPEGRKGKKRAQRPAAAVTWVRDHCLHQNGGSGNEEKVKHE